VAGRGHTMASMTEDTASTTRARDRWAAWLLERRHGGDPEALRVTLEHLGRVRERVLDAAAIAPGETVLDVGCGDGLIALSGGTGT
jgi:2-polyprenyl-3-methyl-5-hydroxy-6-metoxy-1,4-benzoquinol methylase